MGKVAKGANKGVSKVSKWYKADDERVPFARRQLAKKAGKTTLRKNIVPGSVLILLAGRFRGKRVVFLKQLDSGLLLVTGPFKVNGVPLKRVNQAYTLTTSTKVDLAGVKADVNDAYFARETANKNHKNLFKATLTEEQTKKETDRKATRKATQTAVDNALSANIKKVQHLKGYLASKFTLSTNDKPHQLVL